MLCPPLRFVPPPNFVGSVAFDITLANPTDRPADSILETATVQRSVLTTVGLPECMQDAAAVRRTPESFCGEHGVCRGPTGCACDSHWFGVRTTPTVRLSASFELLQPHARRCDATWKARSWSRLRSCGAGGRSFSSWSY